MTLESLAGLRGNLVIHYLEFERKRKFVSCKLKVAHPHSGIGGELENCA